MTSLEHFKPNEVLRLSVAEQVYSCVIVSITEDALMVATTSQKAPEVQAGTTVSGEIFKQHGLYNFTTRLLGFQMMPVLVLILERPRSIRRIQRRREPRHAVDDNARLVFISSQRTINAQVAVRNLSLGGMQILSPEAPPVGLHCVVLLHRDGLELSSICRVLHAAKTTNSFLVGLAFAEMSVQHATQLKNLIQSWESEPDFDTRETYGVT